MKKIIFLFAALILSVAVQAQSITPRFGTTKNSDNTGRVLTYKLVETNDAAGNDTISITPNAWETILRPSSDITDSVNVRAYLTNAKLGDYLSIFINKGSGAGAVRFISTYFVTDVSTNRYTVAASKTNVFKFQFNGVKWIMISKTVQP
jgi:hypothetical protein